MAARASSRARESSVSSSWTKPTRCRDALCALAAETRSNVEVRKRRGLCLLGLFLIALEQGDVIIAVVDSSWAAVSDGNRGCR